MCWASGVLLYGQFITSSSLRFASEAHVELKPQLKAVKLIQHRLRTGKLIVKDQETQKTVRDFTAEIWTRISSVLVSSALEGAEQALVGEYRCEGCKIVLNLDEGPRDASWADKNAERKGEVWKLGWAEPSCEYCLDTLVEKDPFEKPKFVSPSHPRFVSVASALTSCSPPRRRLSSKTSSRCTDCACLTTRSGSRTRRATMTLNRSRPSLSLSSRNALCLLVSSLKVFEWRQAGV